MKFDLSERVALVTGSDRNTGEVIARTLSEAGATVIVHSNADENGVTKLASELEASYSVVGDLASPAGCAAVVEQLQAPNLHLSQSQIRPRQRQFDSLSIRLC